MAIGVIGGGLSMFLGASTFGFESLGVGTESLVGGDLTDPEDDEEPEEDAMAIMRFSTLVTNFVTALRTVDSKLHQYRSPRRFPNRTA